MRRSFLGILLAIAAATNALPTHAATITVTTTTDELNTDGDCSLREAVRAANNNVAVDACTAGQNDQTDTITVPAGTYTLMVPGNDDDASGGDLDLLDNAADLDLVINGAGAATTIIQACAVDQRSAACPADQGVFDRVFHVRGHVKISGVTVRHGRAQRVNIRRGSGIYVDGFSNPAADLTLTDVVVTKNGLFNPDVDVEGGGIANEYGGKLTLIRTIVSENAASGTGDYRGGGGIFNGVGNAVLVMTDSTVSGNTAEGMGAGAGIWNSLGAQATLTGCTISDNLGGGIGNSGHLEPSTMTLTNCTISGNQAIYGAGGITNGSSGATLNLRSSTVTLNRRLLGPSGNGAGGIVGGSGPTVLRNTIVAGNIDDENQNVLSPDCDDNGAATVISEGFSLVGDGTHCTGLVDGVNGDQIGKVGAQIDAKLGPLADNGGPTLTHALLAGSLALDGGDPATPGSGGTACPATDQRGESRPNGPACDVGSFEGGSGGGGAIAVNAVKPTSGGNVGTVQAHLYGKGFVVGATVKLVRAGSADVVGSGSDVGGSTITTSFDLRGAAPGVWSVVVTNPDASTATLADAFTVEVGGGADLWSELILPTAFTAGRYNSIYVVIGNRGTVDAYGVPLWISIPGELEFHIPFRVSAPPSQPGQVPMDWTRIAIDTPIPPPENRDSFSLLLPIVPAGSTTTLKFRVKNPPPPENCHGDECVDPSHLPFKVSEDIGPAYFEPNLSPVVIASYIEQAKAYVAEVLTPGVPSDAAIEAYIRTQLTAVVAHGIADANVSGYPPVYSQAQLIIDTGNFIAAANVHASALEPASRWFAGAVNDFVGDFVSRSAEARITNPECDPGDFTCEHDDAPKPCPIPADCCPIPGVLCNKNPGPIICDRLNQIGLEWVYVPCKPKNNDDRPFDYSWDPNDKHGPGGPGGFIDGVSPVPYEVIFENLPTASGDAFEVTITDQLDVTKYDLDSFSLGPISFADKFVPVPPGLKSFSTEVDLRPGANILVGIHAALDTGTGIVTWKYTTLDPATHEFPEDAVEGFLPPNVTPPQGEGAVLFTVSLKPGFGLGTTVCNKARIVFDLNAPIDTPNFCNTIGAPEDCTNCIDDDGDGKIDRADSDCARADGGGAGVGDATIGKAVDKCAKAIRKVGAKLASNRLKQLGACQKVVADCVQLKPGDATCLTKAQGKCAKVRTALPAAEAKLMAAIVKSCREPAVATANLFGSTGLGFDGEKDVCSDLGMGAVATVADVAECVRRQHLCAAERALGAAVPRARELLVLGGFDPSTDLGCLAATTNGGGSAIAAEKRKALRKCDGAIQKATAKLLAGRTKAGEACGAAVFSCVQTKPGDACLTKAGGACKKAVAALPKLQASFASAIAKSCDEPLVPADLLASEGLGAAGLAASCTRLGFPSLTSVADVSACLERQLACRADQLLESTTPRLGELLGLGGVALP